jgi:hypothetical protein
MPIQIDPNQAESAARMLNGLFGGRSLSAEESFGETTRLDPRGDHKHQK